MSTWRFSKFSKLNNWKRMHFMSSDKDILLPVQQTMPNTASFFKVEQITQP